ncbi:MAG: hypothetical protein LBR10_10700 [Prevotellaceae bacterium]|jgi:hypothetical protein|nr:hypothetical protein [Prevotellaceae bacterium]
MSKENLKKRTSGVITALLILVIVGLGYFTWQRYRWNNPPYAPEINAVLFMAGDNRGELEKVLKHYGANPADSLKLRAAEFLIENMPGKYSLEYDAPFENVVAVYLRWDGLGDKQDVENAFKIGKQIVREDVKHIKGDYLINNIELAFKMWEEQPWGKDVPFDVFCEEILPYRVAYEPLENWREKILVSFAKLNRTFREQPEMTSTEACFKVNSELPRLKLSNWLPKMNYSMILTTSRGMCDEMTALAAFTMRALGIPVTLECTPKWSHRNVGHTWNSVYAGAGRRFSFMGTEANPGATHPGSRMPKSKVYRITYAKQNNFNGIDNNNIPPSVRNPFMKDVTEEYVELFSESPDKKDSLNLLPPRKSIVHDSLHKRGLGVVLDPLSTKGKSVKVPTTNKPANDSKYAFLAVIGENEWNITGWGKIYDDSIDFGTIGRNILYLPVYYVQNTSTAANYPFIIRDDDNLHFFESDTANRRRFTVSNIFLSGDKYKERMINGVFEGANQSDFSDAKVLHVVKKASGECFNTANIQNPATYRYVRYVSSANSHCHVAEVIFYNNKGEKLSGKPIGTPGSYLDSPMTFDKAFDGDISTFYDAKYLNDSWMGLELNEPQTISKIQYLPRNEGNGIYEGHTYELFFREKNDWKLLERQTAVNHLLQFQFPVNTLLYLKNTSTGKLGKWFVITKDGEQEWM